MQAFAAPELLEGEDAYECEVPCLIRPDLILSRLSCPLLDGQGQ